jgi:transcriptional regulator GlxA family with amidase domain
MRNVAIVIWDGAEVLDWAGPAEVFESASRFGQKGSRPAFKVYTVSKTTDAITSQRFISVNPQYSIENAPAPNIIVLPGGGTDSVTEDPAFQAWAGKAAVEAEVALSVCTGAFVLGRAGLLDDRDVTTWYGAMDRLIKSFPKARVHPGRRFIDSGDVITTAGVSAGIDGSLHLVARLLGREVADRTAQYMEYRWTPEPYLAQEYR